MNAYKIGKVEHYYDKIQVAVVKLTADLSVGENIMFERGGEEVSRQRVESIQMDYEKVEHAGSGDIVGLKTKEPIKEGADVFKLQL